MQFYCESGNLTGDVAELDAQLGDLIRQDRIEKLKRRIAERERAHQGTAIYRHELIELMRRQVERECAL